MSATGATSGGGLYDVVGGSITNVRVTNGGSGWVNNPTFTWTGAGPGTGISVTAVKTVNTIDSKSTTGMVTGISIGNAATNGPYPNQPNITITGGSPGSGAAATAVRTGGALAVPTITNAGAGYVSQPNVTLTDGGTYGSGSVVSASMGLNVATIVAAGSGGTPGTYTLGISGGAGAGATGTYTIGGGGTLTAVSITAAGAGFTSLPTLSFPAGGLSGASATVDLKVVSLSRTSSGGSLYYLPTLTIDAPPSGGTQATATVTASTIRVTSAVMTAFGSGYSSSTTGLTTTPTVTIDPPSVAGTTATGGATSEIRVCYSTPLVGTYHIGLPAQTPHWADFLLGVPTATVQQSSFAVCNPATVTVLGTSGLLQLTLLSGESCLCPNCREPIPTGVGTLTDPNTTMSAGNWNYLIPGQTVYDGPTFNVCGAPTTGSVQISYTFGCPTTANGGRISLRQNWTGCASSGARLPVSSGAANRTTLSSSAALSDRVSMPICAGDTHTFTITDGYVNGTVVLSWT